MIHDVQTFTFAILAGLLWAEGIVLLVRIGRGEGMTFHRHPDDDRG